MKDVKPCNQDLGEIGLKLAKKLVASMTKGRKLGRICSDDLVGAALLGYSEAIKRYDKLRGLTFTAYAYARMRGAVIDYLRKEAQIIGYPVYHTDKTKVSIEQTFYNVLSSFDIRVVKYTDGSVDSFSTKDLNVEECLINKERRLRVTHHIEKLPDRDKKLITLRYFQDKTLRDIAKDELQVDGSWVTRLHSAALSNLRGKLERDCLF